MSFKFFNYRDVLVEEDIVNSNPFLYLYIQNKILFKVLINF